MEERPIIYFSAIICLCLIMIQLPGCSTDGSSDVRLSVDVKPKDSGYLTQPSGKFESGTQLEIKAIPYDGFYFQRWEEFGLGDENPLLITLHADRQITAIFSTVPPPVFTTGMGTESNPFHVTTVEQLQAINGPGYLDMHYIQMSDIDASASYEYQHGSGWRQIGSRETPFTGSYNGNGFVIRDLKLHAQRGGPSNGVWGYVKNGRIENVYVDNSVQLSKVRSEDQYLLEPNEQFVKLLTPASAEIDLSGSRGVGGMVGFNDGGEIINSTFHGRVEAVMGSPAGFVGINTGLVENSHFKGTAGGFGGVGFTSINTGKIIDSSTEIRASGMGVFGFVSLNLGEIIRSSAHVDLHGSNITAGFVSNNRGRIESSFVTGEISGRMRVAGFSIENSGVIENSYSNVDASLQYLDDDFFSISGFVFENSTKGVIENSYVTGTVIATGAEAEISAVINENQGSVKSVYWDMDSIGDIDAVFDGSREGITGLTTEQMTGTAAMEFMPAFDWNAVWRTTPDYPILMWQE